MLSIPCGRMGKRDVQVHYGVGARGICQGHQNCLNVAWLGLFALVFREVGIRMFNRRETASKQRDKSYFVFVMGFGLGVILVIRKDTRISRFALFKVIINIFPISMNLAC